MTKWVSWGRVEMRNEFWCGGPLGKSPFRMRENREEGVEVGHRDSDSNYNTQTQVVPYRFQIHQTSVFATKQSVT
jgi:hypothetical protein